ncbi:hypothetical protein HDV03_001227 [Kappamyces sp. JEL0829]|nr:hypothetical protein HDV03_001227 [Kappamyces sp. JEL0829]KAJ3359871.1 hypothetical protein HDU91_004777 [Kappamyces sp. JEL0680]
MISKSGVLSFITFHAALYIFLGLASFFGILGHPELPLPAVISIVTALWDFFGIFFVWISDDYHALLVFNLLAVLLGGTHAFISYLALGLSLWTLVSCVTLLVYPAVIHEHIKATQADDELVAFKQSQSNPIMYLL